ncbi:MAG: Cytosol aminopeptidase family, catalytic domain, partial [Mycetocola sp.]|nr:Cytosol aminopeptidase family, catalytic domain [Mycetocola sp.]
LDIAGPAWADETYELTTRGGTGFGVRTLLQYLLDRAH